MQNRAMRKPYQLVFGLVSFVLLIQLYLYGRSYFISGNKKRPAEPAYEKHVTHMCADMAMSPPKELVPGVKFVLYIISHDDKSFEIATQYSKCKPWARVVRIPTSVFMESAIYGETLMSRKEEWQGVDFVGISTYRSLKFAPLDKLKLLLEVATLHPYDVAPLYSTGEYLMNQAIAGHTVEFAQRWNAVLQAQGYTESEIRAQDRAEVFLRNSMLIRPQWLSKLAQQMTTAMNIIQTNETLRAAFATDAHYREAKYRKKTAEKVFQTKYYQWHPFVFERLPVFYLHHYNASVYGTLREAEWFDFRDSHLLFKGL